MPLVRILAGSLANQSRISPYWSSHPVVYTFPLTCIGHAARRMTILMFHPKTLDVLACRLAGIDLRATGTMQHRFEAHLVYNPQWADRQSLVFGRAWDHECLRDNKKRTT